LLKDVNSKIIKFIKSYSLYARKLISIFVSCLISSYEIIVVYLSALKDLEKQILGNSSSRNNIS